jgi:DHA1 family bicyclomycin/chloramphenicol resistance-like MFS transporter
VRSFAQVLRQPQFYIYTFSGAIASAGMYAYIAGSPNVFIKIFGVSEKHYGWLFAFNAAGLIGCSQLNTLALRRFNSEQISRMALMAQTVIGACLLIGTISGIFTVYTIVPLFFLYLGAQGFIFPNLAALAMAPFSKNAGTASALMGAVQLGIASLATATVSIFSDGTARPMTAIMMSCSAVGLTVLLLGNRYALHRSAPAEKVEEQAVEMVTEA